VHEGRLALPESDAVGLALMFLDTVLVRPIDSEFVEWRELPARIRKHTAHFSDAGWAREMADALASEGGAMRLIPLMVRFAAG
jgi:hypothetical protein